MAVAEEREGEGEVAQPQHHPEGPEAVEGGEEEVQREEKTMFQVICTQFLFLFHTNFMRTHIQVIHPTHVFCASFLSPAV